MHVAILAGGRGVRLRPYTTALPKPLVPIGEEYAILDIILQQLKMQGFTRVTLAIGHLSSLIRAFVGDGSRWGMDVDYSEEDQPLSTIGPLLNFLDRLPEHFLVMNGDVLTDLDYASLLDQHIHWRAPLTVATYQRQVKIDFGTLETVDGHIVKLQRKADAVVQREHGRVRDVTQHAGPLPEKHRVRIRRPGTRPARRGRTHRGPTTSTDTGWISVGQTTTTRPIAHSRNCGPAFSRGSGLPIASRSRRDG